MANLTIAVDDETLKRARIRAIERGESVNAYLAETIRRYAGGPPQSEIMSALHKLALQAAAGHHATGRSWQRDDLYRV